MIVTIGEIIVHTSDKSHDSLHRNSIKSLLGDFSISSWEYAVESCANLDASDEFCMDFVEFWIFRSSSHFSDLMRFRTPRDSQHRERMNDSSMCSVSRKYVQMVR